MRRQVYLDYAYKVADLVWQDYDALRHGAIERGKAVLRDQGKLQNTFQLVGTVAPAEARRYRQTGEMRYLERAKRYLLDVYDVYYTLKTYQQSEQIELRSAGFPTLGWMFEPEPYISAYNEIKDVADFTDRETAHIETVVELAMRPIERMPEYGPMNRSMLRALNLAAAGSSFPQHKEASKWLKMGRHIFADSLDKWSMEDSGAYQGIWLYSFVAYNEYVPTVSTEDSSVVKHYADLWSRLVTPLGFIPDYGDWDLAEDWVHIAAVMEKCATGYQSAALKYAVNRFAEAQIGHASGLAGGIDRFLRQLVAAHDWSDDNLEEQQPPPHSQEACDDTIGKKCAFRNGWDRGSSYLLLNYRDAPETNEIYRKNLTLTIPVKAEKTHHGHNDENALSMLVAQERILLAESGYRKGFERDCTYRSDYYHNKLIVRRGVTKAYSFFDHVLDFGEYNPVRTERIYFYRFDEVDCSRTRLYDARNAAVCDRVIYYLKKEDCFIVNDIVLPQEDGSYTIGPIFHAQNIKPLGRSSYVLSQTEVSRGQELTYTQPDDVKLYLHFPIEGYDFELQAIDRAYRDQMAVSQFFAGYSSDRFPLFFSSILYPSRNSTPSFFDSFCYEKKSKGMGIQFSIGERCYTLFDRYCYESKIEDLNKRPAYSFDAGREHVFGIETDAYAACTIQEGDSVYFSCVDFSALIYKGRPLFEMAAMGQLQLDFNEPLERTTSWSNWDDRVQM